MDATPRCPVCRLDAVPSGSSHNGSTGTLSYLRCVCGLWLVVQGHEVIATAGVSEFTPGLDISDSRCLCGPEEI